MRLSLLIPPVLWAALISIGSNISNPPAAASSPWISYAAHFIEFLVLGALVARAAEGRRRPSRLFAWATGFGAAALFGVVDELHQALVPGRDAAVSDWLFDAFGAMAGAGLWARSLRALPPRWTGLDGLTRGGGAGGD